MKYLQDIHPHDSLWEEEIEGDEYVRIIVKRQNQTLKEQPDQQRVHTPKIKDQPGVSNRELISSNPDVVEKRALASVAQNSREILQHNQRFPNTGIPATLKQEREVRKREADEACAASIQHKVEETTVNMQQARRSPEIVILEER